MESLKSLFLLDPEVVFLNHGSFGAVPRPVFDVYQQWQRRLENQPVQFLSREFHQHSRESRKILADHLGVEPANLVFIPNATFGVNIIARSLSLESGDELLTSNHEYGACLNVLLYLAQTKDIDVIQKEIPLPLPDPDQILAMIWEGVTERTRLIFISHISSPTGVRFPVAEICQKARQVNIPVLIDGAHAPGQVDLNLTDMGVDFYTGNCHKWMMAPKGSAFLYVRPELQDRIHPLVVSWGWGDNTPYESDSSLLELLEWWGTKDPAPYFSVPAALQFQADHNWDQVRKSCREMLAKGIKQIERLTGLPSIYSSQKKNNLQLACAELPGDWRPDKLQEWLYHNYRIEIPVISWEERWFIRPSVQGYNSQEDLELLVEALMEYISLAG